MNEVMKADKEITETIRNNLKLLMNIYGLKTSRFAIIWKTMERNH